MDRSIGRYCFLFIFSSSLVMGKGYFFSFFFCGWEKGRTSVIGEAAEVTEATPITVGDRARGNQGS